MEAPLEEAIFKTLAYADIFDYPLKEEEIWHRLIKLKTQKSRLPKPGAGGQAKVKTTIQNLKFVQEKDGFYFLKGKQKVVELRGKRSRWSKEKLKIAGSVVNWLKIIPTIKMIAVTGNLAVENCDQNDDIDLLIVASSGTLWLTRFLSTLFLEASGQRRRPGQKEIRDKICLNMLMDEQYLQVPPKEQDLYTAHEVVQLKPIWERDKTHQRFLAANLWVRKYLPNAVTLKATKVNTKSYEEKVSGTSCPPSWLFVFEQLAKTIQLRYMRRRRTTEVITEGIIRFHPQDTRGRVLKEYRKRLKKFEG